MSSVLGERYVSILMPYAYAGPERERSFEWITQRWKATLPDAELIVAAPDQVGDPGRFNRPMAINRAAEQANGDIFIIADADTAFNPFSVLDAVERLFGTWSWVLPDRYVRLNARVSDEWLAEDPLSMPPPENWEQGIEEEWPLNVSGVVIVPRRGFKLAGGFDERFRGWGWDDGSFAAAMTTVWGPAHRLENHTAYHLWHPRPPEHSIHGPWAAEQRELGQRYLDAAGNAEAMFALTREWM